MHMHIVCRRMHVKHIISGVVSMVATLYLQLHYHSWIRRKTVIFVMTIYYGLRVMDVAEIIHIS